MSKARLALLAALLAAASATSAFAVEWAAGDFFLTSPVDVAGLVTTYDVQVYPGTGEAVKEVFRLPGGCDTDSRGPALAVDSDSSPRRLWVACKSAALVATKAADGTIAVRTLALPDGARAVGLGIGRTQVFFTDPESGKVYAFDRRTPSAAPTIYDVPQDANYQPAPLAVAVAPSGPGGRDELFLTSDTALDMTNGKFIWRYALPASGNTLSELDFAVLGVPSGSRVSEMASSSDGTRLFLAQSPAGSLPGIPSNCLVSVTIANGAPTFLCMPNTITAVFVAIARGPTGSSDVFTREFAGTSLFRRWTGGEPPAEAVGPFNPKPFFSPFAVLSFPQLRDFEPVCEDSNFIGPGADSWWGPFRPRDGRVDYRLEPIDWIDGCAEKVEKCQAAQAVTFIPAADCLCPAWRCLNPVVKLEPGCEPQKEVKCRSSRPPLLRTYCSLIRDDDIDCGAYLSQELLDKLAMCIDSLPARAAAVRGHAQLRA